MVVAMSQNRLLSACYAFLVPVAQFLLRHGVSYRQFEELARTAYVEVAGKEFSLRGRPTNISRVAAITGIPRKEVSRIRALIDRYGTNPRSEISPLGDILHHWYTDKEFLDSEGYPLALPADGEDLSFEALAKRCVGDLPVGTIKSELLRTGAIEVTSERKLAPVRRQAVPSGFDDKLVTSLSFNLFGLASTVAFNSNPDRASPSRPERFIQSESLPVELRSEMHIVLRKRIEDFAVEIDDMFSTVETVNADDGRRVGVGIYYYEEDK